MAATRSVLASAACLTAALAGCGGSVSSQMDDASAGHRSLTAMQARAVADRAEGGSWHPARVSITYRDDYRLRPGTPKRDVWVVSYIGGDVCIPAHGGDGSAPCANREDVLVDAHTGRFIAASATVDQRRSS